MAEVSKPVDSKPVDPEPKRPQHGSRDKSVPWFNAGLPEVPEAARELLEKYSHIPPDQVQAHVHDVRERAWEIYPYPCIGGYRFLELGLSRNPAYGQVLSLLKDYDSSSGAAAPLLLDIGCCFGQDIRKLRYDGVPGSQLVGADLQAGFIEMGYELFRDRETLGVKFLVGDVLSDAFSSLHGTISVVHASSFFHLWGWDGQIEVACKVVKLLKDQVGVVVVGRQVGSIEPGERQSNSSAKTKMYRHNSDTFQQLWEHIGKATGTKWKVESSLHNHWTNRQKPQGQTNYNSAWHDETTRIITFQVTRIE